MTTEDLLIVLLLSLLVNAVQTVVILWYAPRYTAPRTIREIEKYFAGLDGPLVIGHVLQRIMEDDRSVPMIEGLLDRIATSERAELMAGRFASGVVQTFMNVLTGVGGKEKQIQTKALEKELDQQTGGALTAMSALKQSLPPKLAFLADLPQVQRGLVSVLAGAQPQKENGGSVPAWMN